MPWTPAGSMACRGLPSLAAGRQAGQATGRSEGRCISRQRIRSKARPRIASQRCQQAVIRGVSGAWDDVLVWGSAIAIVSENW
jgi:hypothetical protein